MNIAVPNFRLPKRLISWMQINGIKERVLSAEKVFFKESIDSNQRAWGLVNYSKLVGKLPSEMEDVIALCPAACVGYASSINNDLIPERLIDACGEDPILIVKMAAALRRRIPHLEGNIDTPEDYVSYASEVRSRIPEMEERILFSGRFTEDSLAASAKVLVERLSGHSYYGDLPKDSPSNDPRIKELIKLSPHSVLEYMNFLNQRGLKLPEEFHSVFAGKGLYLYKLAEHLRRRLSLELEATWEGSPHELVQYSVRWVKGRLSEDLEKNVLMGDQKAAASYAFQVVRGFSPVRLPDSLHAFMLMKSFECPEDQEIKRYVQECNRVDEFQKNYCVSGSN